MRPPRVPACFIPIFSRGAPSGQFLAPSTLIRILQGEDAASKLHRFRKPEKKSVCDSTDQIRLIFLRQLIILCLALNRGKGHS